MGKTDVYKVIFSSVFFLFFIFSIFALLVSQFSDIFSQLFLILTGDDRVYTTLIRFFYFFGILMSLGYVVFSAWVQKDIFIQRLFSACICIIFIFIFILNMSISKTFDSIIVGLVSIQEISHLSLTELIGKNFIYIFISGFFYLFFLILPLVVFGFNYQFNQNNKIGKCLAFFCPSLNICIVVLFASAFQAYYDKSNLFLYIDFLTFCVCFILFFQVFLSRKDFLGFYEYANILLLVIGILVFLFCSNTLSQAENYYNARMSFYLLGFLGWCGEWMYHSLIDD
ncbi:hypothetical protein [Helicobacter sp. 13S00477-4]|uniref:hypothetical protein n=1 Tax=Helicobacter sp. 13S00477-4 TaxID=1905759 RepID=UPI000BA577F2|nr:hypothetical protein [Helicobacter sp. 13S00477-4]PAF50542.1 hypothetical protein BKH44_07855 [Helicobacter sp. 13S00477-4]